MTSPDFSTVAPKVSATPQSDIDKKLARLVAKKDEWVGIGTRERAELLEQCMVTTLGVSREWVHAACDAKGIAKGSPREGEEWLGGPMTTLRNLRLFADAMRHGGQPPVPGTRTLPSGQLAVKCYPLDKFDALMLAGVTAEVYIEPGQPASQGRIYREKKEGKTHPGQVALVLGAGNVASIGPMDALYKLFVDDEVVIVKTNPVNAYLQPFWEEAFRPLLDRGYFAVVRGGADVGSYLCNHPDIASIHITGSDRTHDAIVYGGGAEGAKRKAEHRPKLTKPISSELGAVTPCLIVPGDWTEKDLEFQAANVAGMVANNGSFNCNACKVVVTASGWRQRERFLDLVREKLKAVAPRKAYYPGAQDRYQGFLDHYPEADPLSERSRDVVPWTIIPDVTPKAGEYALSNEAFCGVLAETTLEARDAGEFLDKAVAFANDDCWGTLSCMLLIGPAEEKKYKDKLEKAIGDLRYGGIAVNAWAALVYGLVSTTWGAFPGHTLEDIQSGRGVVHNGLLIDHPQKSVVRAPFRPQVKFPYFADHKTAHKLGEALSRFEAAPGWSKIPAIALYGMRG